MLDGLPGEPVHPEVRKFCSAMNKQKVNRGSPTSPFPNLTTEPFMRCKIIFLTLEILNHSVAIERKFQSTSSLIQLTLLNAKVTEESEKATAGKYGEKIGEGGGIITKGK